MYKARKIVSKVSQILTGIAILVIALTAGPLLPKIAQAANPPVYVDYELDKSSLSRSDAVFSHSVASGPYRLLVVAVMIRGDGEVSSITYAGESLTEEIAHGPGT